MDHPRVCGEKRSASRRLAPQRGSPPRVRGKAVSQPHHLNQPRITPACAGKSNSSVLSDFAFGDHPRVCGEKMKTTAIAQNRQGSPPRVRGKATQENKGAFS